MSNNLISIIMPVYNVEDYLKQSIESILMQDCHQYELLLIDDGSKDDSSLICDRYASLYPNVKVFHTENRGVSAARNYGLEQAVGDYILFLDSDDWLEETELLSTLLDHSSDADMVIFSSNWHYGDWIEFDHEKWNYRGILTKQSDIFYSLFRVSPCLWNKMIKKSVIQNITFHESIYYCEDTLFLSEIMDNLSSILVIPELHYNYRRNRVGNINTSAFSEGLFSIMDVSKQLYKKSNLYGAQEIGLYRLAISTLELLDKMSGSKNILNIKYCYRLWSYYIDINYINYLHFIVNPSIPFFLKKQLTIFLINPYLLFLHWMFKKR